MKEKEESNIPINDESFNLDDEVAMYDNCPFCNRHFDAIDYEYQICSICFNCALDAAITD